MKSSRLRRAAIAAAMFVAPAAIAVAPGVAAAGNCTAYGYPASGSGTTAGASATCGGTGSFRVKATRNGVYWLGPCKVLTGSGYKTSIVAIPGTAAPTPSVVGC